MFICQRNEMHCLNMALLQTSAIFHAHVEAEITLQRCLRLEKQTEREYRRYISVNVFNVLSSLGDIQTQHIYAQNVKLNKTTSINLLVHVGAVMDLLQEFEPWLYSNIKYLNNTPQSTLSRFEHCYSANNTLCRVSTNETLFL